MWNFARFSNVAFYFCTSQTGSIYSKIQIQLFMLKQQKSTQWEENIILISGGSELVYRGVTEEVFERIIRFWVFLFSFNKKNRTSFLQWRYPPYPSSASSKQYLSFLLFFRDVFLFFRFLQNMIFENVDEYECSILKSTDVDPF